jgi:hypothetical protein
MGNVIGSPTYDSGVAQHEDRVAGVGLSAHAFEYMTVAVRPCVCRRAVAAYALSG